MIKITNIIERRIDLNGNISMIADLLVDDLEEMTGNTYGDIVLLPTSRIIDTNNAIKMLDSEGNWNEIAQPSGGKSPIAVFSVTFKNPDTQMEMYEHVYWGANDTTHEIVEGVTDYCAELDAAMAEGKAIMIKAYIDDKMFNLVPTSLTYMAGRYTLINNLGQGSGIYYSALNGAWERFKYIKTASSNKDGNFTADIKLSLT